MIILHENMQAEAEKVAAAVKDAYGIESKLVCEDLEQHLVPIPQFEGYHPLSRTLIQHAGELGKAVLILTGKDLFANEESKDDDWVFGVRYDGKQIGVDVDISVASSARMKRNDNQPSKTIEIPMDSYLRRVCTTSVHELGHSFVKGDHLKPAKVVNAKTGYTFSLGPHCPDNKCVMYEIIDIKTPSADDSYLLLGDEPKFDAGLDETIGRMYIDWFCDACRKSIIVDPRFR